MLHLRRATPATSAAMRVPKTPLTLFQVARCGCLLVYCSHAPAQTTSDAPAQHQAVPVDPTEPEEQWTFSASMYAYFPPNARDYLQPTVTADHEFLHLEARYNYEALDSGSVWIGYNFSGGQKLEWQFSPMLGGIFGKLTGVAPGYEASLTWRRVELYSEGEYVIDTANSSGSYFYNWSELSLSALDWFRVGAVIQHTHVYQTDREIQRGLLVRLSYKHTVLTGYVFNPDDSTPTIVIALRMSW